MSLGILGTKLGMTQIFDNETGTAIPVTVVQAGPCTVTQIKTSETDGYTSVQIGYGDVKEKNLTKPQLGHLKKADAAPSATSRNIASMTFLAMNLAKRSLRIFLRPAKLSMFLEIPLVVVSLVIKNAITLSEAT